MSTARPAPDRPRHDSGEERAASPTLGPAARRLLRFLAAGPAIGGDGRDPALRRIGDATVERFRTVPDALEALRRAGLVARLAGGEWALTAAGRAGLDEGDVARGAGPRRLVAENRTDPHGGAVTLLVDPAESPLAWLGRRRDRDGRPLIAAEELAAGERLRLDFTRGGLMPALGSNWRALAAPTGGRGAGPADLADAAIAARERVGRAVEAVGPELGGLLLDVCCFLKGLETVEAERRWPPRSAKVVLRIALGRLAAHYGIAAAVTGPAAARITRWGASDYRPTVTPRA